MRIHDLLDAGQLRIRMLHAGPGALHLPVNWIFTTDLLDPRRYLIRGQLVMTGMMWRRAPADSETFVSAVSGSGAVALLAGEGLFGEIPADVVEACRHHDLPLLAVPADVSFASIGAYVSNTLANDRVSRVQASLSRQRELLTDAHRGELLDELIARTSRDLGRPIWMVTATGRQVTTPMEAIADDDLERVVAAALSAPRLPVTLTDSHDETLMVFPVGGHDDHRTTDWFLVVAGDWNQSHPLLLDTSNELAAVAALYRVQSSGRADEISKLVDRMIALIQSDGDQAELAFALRQVGIETGQHTVVVAAEFTGRPDLQVLAAWLLSDAIGHVARPVVGRDGHRVIGLVPVSATSPITQPREIELIDRALRRLGPGLPDVVLQVGLSSVASVDDLGGALRSARFALSMPDADRVKSAGPVRIKDSARLTSAQQLLATVPDQLRQIFVERTLRPVIDHDRRYSSSLMATLNAYLECGGSWVRTAEQTHLHLNTVRYRIGRIEELTGRNLNVTADRADLYLALKLR